MTDTTEAVETITLPADPEALGRAIVERYEVTDLFTISHELSNALPKPQSMAEVLKEMVADWIPPPPPDPATFSEQQLKIVRHLYHEYQIAKREHEAGFRGDFWYRLWWRPEDLGGEMTPSRRASISRAFRRLEERRIVYRWPGPGGRRSIHVSFDMDGVKLAERLINE